MKKYLVLLLLLLPCLLQAQVVEKFPKSATNPFGYVTLKPTISLPVCPVVIYLHGAGGRGNGSGSALDDLITQVPPTLKSAVEKFNIMVVAPQYSDAGNNAVIDHAISKALAIPGVDPKKIIGACFSMGGGEFTRWVTSSQENADKLSLLIVVAGLNGLKTDGIKFITQSKLPVIYFHANNDPAASVNNSKNGQSAINAQNPAVPAKGVYYTDGGHDVTTKVFDADKFPWTGNEIPANIYEYALPLTNEAPATVPVASGPVLPVPIADDIVTTVNQIQLIGSKSRNAIPDKSKWACVAAPAGTSIWAVNGCGYINCDKVVLPIEGIYKFRLTVVDAAGQTATKDISVTYNKTGTPQEPEPPVPVKIIVGRFFYGGWELVIYSDGSTEKK